MNENMQLWLEAMAHLKAGNAEAAERVADKMKIDSDARLVRQKAAAVRQSVRSDDA